MSSTHIRFRKEEAAKHLGDIFKKVMPLAEVERKTILGTMIAAKGHTETAAEWLGIGRMTLYRRLRSYNYPACLKS